MGDNKVSQQRTNALIQDFHSMIMFTKTIHFLALCMTCNAFRHVVKTIRVGNGGEWGDWGKAEYCPKGKFAVRYQMKIESDQGNGDDSALNGIRLLCGTNTTRECHGNNITSEVGPWGEWDRCYGTCNGSKFLTSFRLLVEPDQGYFSDDSSANYINFRCRSFWGGDEGELRQDDGEGGWETFGGWSDSCNEGSAICGIETRVEDDQGSLPHQDDTGLNNVLFHCCDNRYT